MAHRPSRFALRELAAAPIESNRTRPFAFALAAVVFALTWMLAAGESALGREWAAASFSLCLGLLAFAAVAAPGNVPTRALGLVASRLRGRRRVAALALGLLWIALASHFFSPSTAVGISGSRAAMEMGWLRHSLAVVAGAVGLVVLPALCEELFFRGFLQRALTTPMGPGLAILASSVAFAAFHVGPGAIAFAFLASLLLGLLVRLSGSLWDAIALHAAYNALVFATSL